MSLVVLEKRDFYLMEIPRGCWACWGTQWAGDWSMECSPDCPMWQQTSRDAGRGMASKLEYRTEIACSGVDWKMGCREGSILIFLKQDT